MLKVALIDNYGRIPACSEPRLGFKSAKETSPRIKLRPLAEAARDNQLK
jgi:hypothetical protein